MDGLTIEGAAMGAAVGGLVGFVVGYFAKSNDIEWGWALIGWGVATAFILSTLGFIASGTPETGGDPATRVAFSVGKVFGGYGVAATLAGIFGGLLGVGAAEDQKNKV